MKATLVSEMSISNMESIDDNWASQFAGEWKDSRSEEAVIEDIRNSWISNREIEVSPQIRS